MISSMMLLLSKTTLDVEACSMIMAVISTIVFGIIVLLIWLAVNNILL
ncbi:MbpY [Staphylococcus phage A5W]|uniref:MbpY n=1 Tax=Staphylococcus phage A5W TaxID=516541 RepID=W8S0G8_9CAUD|nr:MbpY [Staphylococcus phage A5W]AHL83350.1 MbpY [Staphylococcus phage A5W]